MAKNKNTKQSKSVTNSMTTLKNPHQKNLQKTIVLYIFFIFGLKIYSSELEARIDFIEQFFFKLVYSFKYTDIWPLGVHLSFASGSGTCEEQV